MVEVSCLICGKTTQTYPSIAKTKKFCSKICAGRSTSGRVVSDETKQKISSGLERAHKKNPGPWRNDYTVSNETKKKISKAHKGRKLTPEWIANRTEGQRGLKRSLETRLKLSLAKRGPGSPNWRGGVSQKNRSERKQIMSTFAYRKWRQDVFERDNYTCVECEQRGGSLHADHIKPFSTHPDLRFCLENGRTLCIQCHQKTPTWGGRLFSK